MTHPIVRWALVLALLQAWPAAAQDAGREAAPESEAAAESAAPQRPETYPYLAAGLAEMGAPVIDVRSAEEIDETGMIDGATHIPHTELDRIAGLIGDDRDRAVVLYCGSGRRVGLVIDALRERGFAGLVNAGGYEDLRQVLQGAD